MDPLSKTQKVVVLVIPWRGWTTERLLRAVFKRAKPVVLVIQWCELDHGTLAPAVFRPFEHGLTRLLRIPGSHRPITR